MREDTRAQGNAYIRSHFGIDPGRLQAGEWSELFAQAFYIEQSRFENLTRVLVDILKAAMGKNPNNDHR